jgi:hypothetical protein
MPVNSRQREPNARWPMYVTSSRATTLRRRASPSPAQACPPRTSPPSSSATAATGKPAAPPARPITTADRGEPAADETGENRPPRAPGPRGRRHGTPARPTQTASALPPAGRPNPHRRGPAFRYTPGLVPRPIPPVGNRARGRTRLHAGDRGSGYCRYRRRRTGGSAHVAVAPLT